MADDTAAAQEQGPRPNPRKVREGMVVSTSMDNKTVQRTNKLYVHDETNDLNVGDRVRVQETRPLSKLKRWRVVDVLERAR